VLDRTLRCFDLRRKERTVVLYEVPEGQTLLRVAWSHVEPTMIALVAQNSASVVIVDTRKPTIPHSEFHGHTACVNEITWSPSSTHLCSVGDDGAAMIWDVSGQTQREQLETVPALQYNAGSAINGLSWSTICPQWLAITFGKKMQLLRV